MRFPFQTGALRKMLRVSACLMLAALFVAVSGPHGTAVERAPLARVAVVMSAIGKPLEGAWLYAYFVDPATGGLRWTDQRGTGSDGRCVLEDGEGFGRGRYVIVAWCEGYRYEEQTVSWDGKSPVEVSFALEVEKPIADVTVADAATGLPIAEALVDAFFIDAASGRELWAARAQTTGTGGCRLADECGCGAGKYRVQAYAPGFVTASRAVVWDGAKLLKIALRCQPLSHP